METSPALKADQVASTSSSTLYGEDSAIIDRFPAESAATPAAIEIIFDESLTLLSASRVTVYFFPLVPATSWKSFPRAEVTESKPMSLTIKPVTLSENSMVTVVVSPARSASSPNVIDATVGFSVSTEVPLDTEVAGVWTFPAASRAPETSKVISDISTPASATVYSIV